MYLEQYVYIGKIQANKKKHTHNNNKEKKENRKLHTSINIQLTLTHMIADLQC